MAMTIAYVVNEVSFNYNDEIYRNDGDGGQPHKIYLDENEVKEAVLKLNAQKFDGLEVWNYCYDISEISNLERKEIDTELNKIIGQANMDSLTIPEGLSLAKLKKIASIFDKLVFYCVHEVEVID